MPSMLSMYLLALGCIKDKIYKKKYDVLFRISLTFRRNCNSK